MATQTLYKIIFNGVLLPDIYFCYDDAKQAFKAMQARSCAGQGRIVLYDDQTGEIS